MWDKVARLYRLMVAAALLGALGCRGEPATTTRAAPRKSSARKPEAKRAPPKPVQAPSVPTRYTDAARIVAFGDVHGDLGATRRALQLAGAIDDEDRWVGRDLVVVQTGDQLDRGSEERAILDLLVKLSAAAQKDGGALHVLNGNHEIMNAAGDFRYVAPGGFADFNDVEGLDLEAPELRRFKEGQRPRAAALLPGGPYAKVLGARNVVIVVGDTVFAHGGVLPKYAAKVDAINENLRAWLFGAVASKRDALKEVMAMDSVIWTRRYSEGDPGAEDCRLLGEALRALAATRMVVGHTVQKGGITSGCDDRVWRIDVGLAEGYGGTLQVLEIRGGKVSILAP